MTLVFGGDRLFEAAVQIVHADGGNGKRNQLEDDSFAAHALLEGLDHARIVLVGGEDFVAGLQVDAVLRVLQRFAGIAGDGDLFGSQPAASARRRRTVSTW
jgi:hypothetical protein